DRFRERAIRLQPNRYRARGSRLVLERLEKTLAESEPARLFRDPHALEFGRQLSLELDSAAPDRSASHPPDYECTAGAREHPCIGVQAARRIEPDIEALVQLGEVLRQTPSRSRGPWIFDVEPNHRRLQ